MGAFTYAAAQACLRAGRPPLLDEAGWQGLLAADTLAAARALLPAAPPGRTAAWARRLARFLPPAPRRLLSWHNRRGQVADLKVVLRGVHYGVARERSLAALPADADPNWRAAALLDAESVPALVERLQGTPFARPLRGALERYRQEGRCFSLEIALDLDFGRRLVRLIEALGSSDRQAARASLGRRLAVDNLLWAYRFRRAAMKPEEIINYTLHRAFGAGLAMVRRIALGAPLAEEAGRLGLPLPAELPETDGLAEIERRARRARYAWAAAGRSHGGFGLGAVLAGMELLELEAHDLNLVLEAKALGLRAEAIAPRLARAA